MATNNKSKTNRRGRARAAYERLLEYLKTRHYAVKRSDGSLRPISEARLAKIAEEAQHLQSIYHF